MPDSARDNGSTLVNAQNNLGESVLHYACLISKSQAHHPTEDKDLVKLLLQNGGEVNVPNKEGNSLFVIMTCIHYCSKEGNADILHEILNQIDPTMLQGACNRIALNGWTPLLYACQKGHPEVVNLLLQNSARVDVFDEGGKAALHLAAEFGHGEVVDILLKHKAFANARSKKGMTPLHLAARNGYTEIVQKLVSQYGATLDALTLTKRTPLHLAAENGQLDVCSTGQTPLLLAAENDHPEVVKLFLRHKPELVSMANSNGFTCAHIAAMKGSVAVIKELMKFNRSMVTSARNLTGNTALHLAASGGHAEVVKVLIEAGSSATEENADGYTALHFAAKDGHVKVLQTLKSATGMTALHVAASCGQTEFVQEMLTQIPATIPSERPGDTSLSDDYGFTPLHLAAESGHEGVVRVLLNSSGVQTDCATVVQGILPMHLAARGGHLAVAGLLLSRSTEQLQTADKQGRTPLHMASAQGHREMVGLLLGQGADINVADNNGWTALHYTTRHGFLDVVQLLVNSGASPTAATNDGKVPLCLAAAAGHYDVLNYLLKKEHDTHVLMADSNFLIDLMVSSKAHANKPVLEFVLVSAAPIETAAKMARSYQLLSLKEKDRARDLEVMAIFCEAMAADLLGITAISYNTGTLLRSVDSQNQPFLDVLIELQQKEVVAHPAVQNVPIDLDCLFFTIGPQIHQHTNHQVHVLLGVTYILHLPVIVHHRQPMATPVEVNSPYSIHTRMVASHLAHWSLGVGRDEPERQGRSRFHKSHHHDSWVNGYFNTRTSIRFSRRPLNTSVSVHPQPVPCRRTPPLFRGVLELLTFHHLFGPWTVIIRDLIKDLMRFLAILGIFLVGFSLHLCAIYQPVFLPQGADNLTLVVFQSPIDTFEMLFFALFGLVEPDYMPPMHLSPGFSKAIMKVVFGIYMMVTVIVLINLLIAMMSNTYQRIQAQSDTEWKFGRAKLIRNMNKTSPSPSPICLFTLFGELFYRCPKKITGVKPQLHLMKSKRDAAIQRGDVPRIMPAAWQRRCTRRSQQIMPVVQNLTAGRPIAKVVDWPSIVVKYLEVTGADIKMELPEESHPGD
ncbi:ankyrin-1 [Caerostris extrusa]|uniref:Ankyrin-1 n=1 Tax=Caerostris extrusa TaxID=172846 RepID=A0AAV4TPW5_CAEEX|nr:ankyrin-1 [Caerostris extrusa]